MEDLADLTSLEGESLADLLGSDALPPAAINLAPAASSSVKIPTTKKPEKKSEESSAAKIMRLPAVWIGVAGLVVVVVILAVVLSRPSSETTPQQAVVSAPPYESLQAESPAPSVEAPETSEPAEDEQPESSGEQPSELGGGLPPETDAEQRPEGPMFEGPTADPLGVGGDPFGVAGSSTTGAQEAPPETASRLGQSNQQGTTDGPEAAPEPTEAPEPEKIDPQTLFAGIRALSFQLKSVDKNPNSKLNLMVKQAAIQAAQRARLAAINDAPARMHITLEVKEGEELAVVMMSAKLECRAPEKEEEKKDEMVEVWQHREPVARVAWHLLRRGTVPVTIRQGVGDFFDRFVKDFEQVRARQAKLLEAGPRDDVNAPEAGGTRSGRP